MAEDVGRVYEKGRVGVNSLRQNLSCLSRDKERSHVQSLMFHPRVVFGFRQSMINPPPAHSAVSIIIAFSL